MYQPMLFLHWKQIRLALVPFMIASFGLPLMAVQGLGTPPGMAETSLEAYRYVASFEVWLPFYPLLAGAIGVTLALSAWNWDHQLNHVYALSLPLSRMEYTMLKMGAGGVLALLPVAALWLGAHLAAASITLPTGLHAYPNQLALRFLFAILLSYAVLFSMAAGTVKTTGWVIGVSIAFIVFGTLATEMLSPYVEFFARTHVVESVGRWISEGPGPFGVFTGSWALIDV